MNAHPETMALRNKLPAGVPAPARQGSAVLLFCPCSRLPQSSTVLDLANKSTKRDVTLGGCSLSKQPFLMLLKGSTRFNKAKTLNINQVSILHTGFGFSPEESPRRILPGEMLAEGQEGRGLPGGKVVSSSRKGDCWVFTNTSKQFSI